MSDFLTLGLDIGGTSSRAVVISADGRRHGSGVAGGGNPTTHGPAALKQVATALTDALAAVDPSDVRAATLGMAGYARLNADPQLRSAFDATWAAVGLACPYRLASDVLVAYAAGTSAPDGTVVVAGTGAIAARVRGHELDHVADGHGWLLGDVGSGYWLGREAVRIALADLDRERPPGPLAAAVLRTLLGTDAIATRRRDTAHALVQVINAQPPITLARLAPLVLQRYGADDPAAVDLVQRAAAHLADTVASVRRPDETTPLVRGGGLLTSDTALAGELSAVLGVSWPASTVYAAGDAAAAAAWLALLPHVDDDPASVHRILGLS
jgi:N-acetylglucosamine kinase-like BadF-type ATPase